MLLVYSGHFWLWFLCSLYTVLTRVWNDGTHSFALKRGGTEPGVVVYLFNPGPGRQRQVTLLVTGIASTRVRSHLNKQNLVLNLLLKTKL